MPLRSVRDSEQSIRLTGCTCGDAADSKMISKRARALRYVARCKKPGTPLKAFMTEAGGVNTLATRNLSGPVIDGIKGHGRPASVLRPHGGGGAGGRGGRGGGGLGLGLGFGVGWTLLLNFHSEPDDRRQDGVFARRSHRERQRLIRERTAHINRIKGSLFGQGIRDVDVRAALGRTKNR
jgi:hypothetical protein